ncbi:MAG: hypothetical protein ACERKV_03010 [Clostridiaceae bacterium]
MIKINWERLYSALKMTREGKDTEPIEDILYKDNINETITVRDIEKMEPNEAKEAVINYLTVVANIK